MKGGAVEYASIGDMLAETMTLVVGSFPGRASAGFGPGISHVQEIVRRWEQATLLTGSVRMQRVLDVVIRKTGCVIAIDSSGVSVFKEG